MEKNEQESWLNPLSTDKRRGKEEDPSRRVASGSIKRGRTRMDFDRVLSGLFDNKKDEE